MFDSLFVSCLHPTNNINDNRTNSLYHMQMNNRSLTWNTWMKDVFKLLGVICVYASINSATGRSKTWRTGFELYIYHFFIWSRTNHSIASLHINFLIRNVKKCYSPHAFFGHSVNKANIQVFFNHSPTYIITLGEWSDFVCPLFCSHKSFVWHW